MNPVSDEISLSYVLSAGTRRVHRCTSTHSVFSLLFTLIKPFRNSTRIGHVPRDDDLIDLILLSSDPSHSMHTCLMVLSWKYPIPLITEFPVEERSSTVSSRGARNIFIYFHSFLPFARLGRYTLYARRNKEGERLFTTPTDDKRTN